MASSFLASRWDSLSLIRRFNDLCPIKNGQLTSSTPPSIFSDVFFWHIPEQSDQGLRHYPQCAFPLQWRHNKRDGASNHPRLDCLLLDHLFKRRSKKTSKLHVTGLGEGKPPLIDGFPLQRASNAENVSIWWRHHAPMLQDTCPGQTTEAAAMPSHIHLSELVSAISVPHSPPLT